MLNEVEALVALTSIPYLGAVKIKVLLQHFGSALNALNTTPDIIEELNLNSPFIKHYGYKQAEYGINNNFDLNNFDLNEKESNYFIKKIILDKKISQMRNLNKKCCIQII